MPFFLLNISRNVSNEFSIENHPIIAYSLMAQIIQYITIFIYMGIGHIAGYLPW
jgi:hypothetical protein